MYSRWTKYTYSIEMNSPKANTLETGHLANREAFSDVRWYSTLDC